VVQAGVCACWCGTHLQLLLLLHVELLLHMRSVNCSMPHS
jgi:hypothetical protein